MAQDPSQTTSLSNSDTGYVRPRAWEQDEAQLLKYVEESINWHREKSGIWQWRADKTSLLLVIEGALTPVLVTLSANFQLVLGPVQAIHNGLRPCESGRMAQTVCIILSSLDRQMLEAIVADRNRPRKHVERAAVVLAAANRDPVQRWRSAAGRQPSDGLALATALCGRGRGRSAARQDAQARQAAGRRRNGGPRGGADLRRAAASATHWTGRAMARAVGISLTSVQRIWAAHKLQPHRVRTFKRSRDPDFAAKLTDIVGLYMDPPTQAVVLSIDEKSQIQALDRTQPGLPIKPGRCGTMTHDYKRHGTTTLFAAFNVLDGTVIGRCMQQHRHEEFIRFLNDVERAVPAGKLIEAVVDNYATHKHPKVKAWLERHPRGPFTSRRPRDRG